MSKNDESAAQKSPISQFEAILSAFDNGNAIYIKQLHILESQLGKIAGEDQEKTIVSNEVGDQAMLTVLGKLYAQLHILQKSNEKLERLVQKTLTLV